MRPLMVLFSLTDRSRDHKLKNVVDYYLFCAIIIKALYEHYTHHGLGIPCTSWC